MNKINLKCGGHVYIEPFDDNWAEIMKQAIWDELEEENV